MLTPNGVSTDFHNFHRNANINVECRSGIHDEKCASGFFHANTCPSVSELQTYRIWFTFFQLHNSQCKTSWHGNLVWKKAVALILHRAVKTCAKPRSQSLSYTHVHIEIQNDPSIHPGSWCIHPALLLHVIISPFINNPASVIQRWRGGGGGATPDEAGIIVVVGVRQTTCVNLQA